MADKPLRRLLFGLLAPLPRGTRLALDRRLRGAKEARKLRRADAVVVSFPKSGRTWMRALLSFYHAGSRGLVTDELLGFDNYHARDPSIPKILFTHDNHLADLSAFLRDPQWGLLRHLAFLERWRRRMERLPRILTVRYEDLKADTARELDRVLRFLGEDPAPDAVARAVAEASLERMREKERAGAFAAPSRRFGAPVEHPDAFKVREGRVGGWRRHFSAADAAWIERTMAEHMPAGFGYRPEEVSAAGRELGDLARQG